MLTSKLQVVVLAGGSSSRFFPFNNRHKSLFIVAGKPILAYTLESIKTLGVKKIIIVVSEKETIKFMKEYEPKGLKIEYVIQRFAEGQGNAILTAAKKITSDFFVINTQHINFHEIAPDLISTHSAKKPVATVACRHTDTPSLYGILKLKNGNVKSLVEKPKPTYKLSNKRITGIYLFKKDFLQILESTPKGEYQLEAAIENAIPQTVVATEVKKDLHTLKYPWHLLAMKNSILEKQKPYISKKAYIAPTAIIEGNVVIKAGAKIFHYAIIQGPAYIGKGAVVGAYSQVRAGTILEDNAVAQRYCDIKGSHMSNGSSIHSGFIGDSVIGSNVNIGAGFITANKRIDRGTIAPYVKGAKVSADTASLGVIIGDNSKIGINASTMPGAILAPHSFVKPLEIVKGTSLPKQILLVDLDNILFNTELFRRNNLKYSSDVLNNKYLYKDAIKFLKQASKNFSLILFSEGELDFQLEKIKNTNLKNIAWYELLICKPYTKMRNLKNVWWLKNVSYIIDDKASIIDNANKLGIKTIRVKRGKYRNLKTKKKPTATVTNLSQIIERGLV